MRKEHQKNLALLKRRRRLGLTQGDLAERTGLTRKTIYNAENCVKVSGATMLLIADTLDTTIEQIFPEQLFKDS